jgi:hypothetical protein
MNTPLEDRVHDALHRAADPLHRAPFDVTDVRRRARRIQRRRAVAAGAAVAAALAIAVPVGLTMTGPAQRSDVPPATQPPTVTGTVRIDPRSAPVGEPPAVPLVDSTARTVTVGDEVVTLPKSYEQVTQFGDGWIGAIRQEDGRWTVDWLTPDLEVEDSTQGNSELTVSPDGSRVAWAFFDGLAWRVLNHDTAREELERAGTPVPQGAAGSEVGTVGFVSDDEVLGYQLDEASGTFSYFLADAEDLVPYPGIEEPASASPATGMVAGRTTVDDGRSCAATFDGRTRSAEPLWTDCERELTPFSPDGSLLAAFPTADQGTDGDPPGVSILDAATGRPLVDFAVTPARSRVVDVATQVVWEDDEHLLATYTDGDQQYVVRLGLDGTVERVAGPVTVELGTVGLRVTPGAVR